MSIFRKLLGKNQEPLFRLIPPRSSDDLGPWAPHFPTYTEIVGYSSLGHVFLRNPSNQDYAVLHPFKGAAKFYGKHPSISDFEKNVLRESGFESSVLRPIQVQAVAKRLGPLKDDEIYIPVPYPMFGGSDEPETYHKGILWVFLDIVAQMGGL